MIGNSNLLKEVIKVGTLNRKVVDNLYRLIESGWEVSKNNAGDNGIEDGEYKLRRYFSDGRTVKLYTTNVFLGKVNIDVVQGINDHAKGLLKQKQNDDIKQKVYLDPNSRSVREIK